jgi:hypothetical protein
MRSDEISFIRNRYQELSKNYSKIVNIFTVIIAFWIASLIIGRRYNAMLSNKVLEPTFYFQIVLISILLWLFLALGIYFIMVYRYYMDSKWKQKTIEPIVVNYKHSLEIDGKPKYYVCLWHFKHKVVEVTPADYVIINVGDQINIEYARYSKEFFSYF